MRQSTREFSSVLIYLAALTSGVLAALAVQIWFSAAGFDPGGTLQNLFSAKTLQLRAAGPWWAIAGAAFVASGAMAAALSRLPLPWHRLRILRWILAGVMVFGLSQIGHLAGPSSGHASAGATVLANFAAIGLASIMALLGAYFTARR
jgi:hypothetical protein